MVEKRRASASQSVARQEIRQVGEHRRHEDAEIQKEAEPHVQRRREHDRRAPRPANGERREQQERERRLDRERGPGERGGLPGLDPPAHPEAERRDDAVLVEHPVDDGALAPVRARLLDRVEEVDDDELEAEREHRARDDRLVRRHVSRHEVRRGLLRARAHARDERVDRPARPRRQEERPERELGEDDVAAVLDEDRARVKREHAEEARELREARAPTDEQREIGERADEEAEHRLELRRGHEEEREDVREGRPPEDRVVREQPVVRVPDVELDGAAREVEEQHERERDAPGREAPRVGFEIGSLQPSGHVRSRSMKLYDSAISGNSYKVRLLLSHLGRPCEIVPIDILKGESRTPEFLARNPNGRTPVIEDGRLRARRIERDPRVPRERHEVPPRRSRKFAAAFQWMFFEQYSHEPYIATSRFHLLHSPRDPRAHPPARRETRRRLGRAPRDGSASRDATVLRGHATRSRTSPCSPTRK